MTELSNKFYKCTLAVLIASSLSACNSSDTTEVAEDILPEPVLQTISGKTADGYLVNARVCLDLNANLVCDANEPEAVSTEGGNYLIENIAEDVDLSTARIIVEVIPNQTIDEDKPTEAIVEGYTLTSPPGQTDFVSPITTIIDTVMQNDVDLTIEEAESVVKEKLGITAESNIDLFEDYVAASDDETKIETNDDYQRLHIVAQVVTNVLAQTLADVSELSPELTSDAFEETLNAVVSNVEENLHELVNVIDEVIAATAEGEDIAEAVHNSDAVTYVSDETKLPANEVEDKIQQIEEVRTAVHANIETLLTEQQGFFFLDSDHDYHFDGQLCLTSAEFEYDQFKIVDGLGLEKEWRYNPETQSFEAELADDGDFDHQFYQLGAEGWSLGQESTPQVKSFSDDGTILTVDFPGQGSRTVIAKEISLAEKELVSIAHLDKGWAEQMSASTVFSAESTMYSLKMEQLDDAYISPVFDCHEDGMGADGNCNNIWLEHKDSTAVYVDGRATELSALINQNWDGADVASLTKFYSMFGRDLMMAFVEQQTETNETLRYSLFLKPNWDCYQDKVDDNGNLVECQPYHQVAKSTWREETINGQAAIFIDPPLGLDGYENDDEYNGKFLAEIDGFVRVGMYLSKGRIWREEFALNANAIEEVIQGFVTPNTIDDVAKEACGIFEPQPEDDSPITDKDQTADEPTTPPTHDEPVDEDKAQGPAPELIADAEKTALLTGSVYVMEQSQLDEQVLSQTIMVQFINSDSVQVLINETFWNQTDEKEYQEESVQLGQWIIDENNQLLIKFSHRDVTADGQVKEYTEWKLFKIDGDIGHAVTLIDQTDGDAGDIYQLSQFDGLNIESSTGQSIITIARADAENCSLVLNFNDSSQTKGSGFVNATLCNDIAEEEGEQFEFTWEFSELGQLSLTTIGANGEAGHQVDFYQNADGVIYTVSQGVEQYQDPSSGTLEEYHYASIEKWQIVTE